MANSVPRPKVNEPFYEIWKLIEGRVPEKLTRFQDMNVEDDLFGDFDAYTLGHKPLERESIWENLREKSDKFRNYDDIFQVNLSNDKKDIQKSISKQENLGKQGHIVNKYHEQVKALYNICNEERMVSWLTPSANPRTDRIIYENWWWQIDAFLEWFQDEYSDFIISEKFPTIAHRHSLLSPLTTRSALAQALGMSHSSFSKQGSKWKEMFDSADEKGAVAVPMDILFKLHTEYCQRKRTKAKADSETALHAYLKKKVT